MSFEEIKKLRAEQAKLQAYHLMEVAGELFPDEKVRYCCKKLIMGKGHLEVYYSPTKGVVSYKNLYTCKNIWICAGCARRMCYRRWA